MRPCFTALTISKRDGEPCSPSLMPGQTIRREISRAMPRAEVVLPRPTTCWHATAAPGGRWTEPEVSMAEKRKISLVLADVDGTLVTEQKVLTERAQRAVRALQSAGVRFAITSGRPPRGMAMLLDALRLETPIAGFNGGLFVRPDLTILEQKTLPYDVAAKSIEMMRANGLDAWVYRGNDWLITRSDAPHVAREAWT